MKTILAEPSYQALIREAFIDPIRSVLIVDDQYPTIEEHLLSAQSTEEPAETTIQASSRSKEWRKNPDEIQEIISYFRNKKWLVDIHDGTGISLDNVDELIPHLHQSDLLILDYQLDAQLGSADKCIKIIEHLALNDHFNLVVIHTEYDIATAQQEVLLSLMHPCSIIESKVKNPDEVLDAIKEWEIDDDNIFSNLKSCISDSLYIELRKNPGMCMSEMNQGEGGKFNKFVSLYNGKPDSVSLSKVKLFFWVTLKKQELISRKFAQSTEIATPEWSTGKSGENWIRTDRLFITVASKQKEDVPSTHQAAAGKINTKNLPELLLKALSCWKPLPPRLVLSKLRSAISNTGVASEDLFLSNKELQAGWYRELLESGEDQIKSNIESTVEKYWNGLSKPIIGDISQFTKTVTDCDKPQIKSHKEIIQEHFCTIPLSNDDWKKFKHQSILERNAYNCSQEPSGWHLTTGHVLEINEAYWVCLTPACDLVPRDDTGSRIKRLNGTMPFKAVKLHVADNQNAINGAQSNQYLFFRINDQIKTFSFIQVENMESEVIQGTPNPTWDEMFALNKGRIAKNDNFAIQVGQISSCENNRLKPNWHDAKVVSQLRYEYALNLMQRLGSTLTRIGLDFIN